MEPLKKHARRLAVITVAVSTLVILAPDSASGSDFKTSLAPFFDLYCNDCHSDGTAEGDLALDELASDLHEESTFAKWERIFDRVANKEMPPQDSDQPSDKHRETFAKLLSKPLTATHAAHKGTVLRRLNRLEYENTMNDLFGTKLDLISLFPEDGRSHEFDNVGEALSISMVQLKRYLEAADRVMDDAIAKSTARPEVERIKTGYAETSEGKKFIGDVWKQLDDGAVVFFRGGGYPSGMLRTARTRKPGRYKIRVTGYAYQSEEPITFAVGGTTFQRGAQKPTYGYFAFPPNEPTTIELEVWIDNNYMVEITPWGIGDNSNILRKEGADKYPGPGLAIQHVELEGPIIDQFPSRGHRLIFDGLNRVEIEPSNPNTKTKSWYVPKFKILADEPTAVAAQSLSRIATAAFRRPVESSEVQRYVDLFDQQLSEGAAVEDALRTAVAAIFCSPDFLYLQEPEGWLDNYALASRLSYCLARSTPDELLLQAASEGKLAKDPQALLSHVRRLLNDPRNERFVVDFTDAWLNLRDIDFTTPDDALFPEFDQFLQFSMLEETRSFVRSLIRNDENVRSLVAPEYAMLNNRLALHYGIDGVTSPEMQKVAISSDNVRGGLLAHASILKVSANGTNTSPVVRGVWVMERLLGETPPPPPPGVPGVEPDIRGASTLRELLAKHRDSDNCRSCHAKIDPPGFALESFNPIGGWRKNYRSLGNGEKLDLEVNGRRVRYRRGPEVDASGNLEDGREFDGFAKFRDYLATDEDALAKTLATKLLTFATGREMGFSDRPTIEKIVAKSKESGHGIRNLIELVVLSEAFRRK